MALRNHFQSPIHPHHSWEGFHASWPLTIVNRLFSVLPDGYLAEPRVRLGNQFEVDVGAFDLNPSEWVAESNGTGSGGTATATWAPPKPTVVSEAEYGEEAEYSVSIYRIDEEEESTRKLVAAIELVSPANKDRPLTRRALAAKCAALLKQGICVSLVDFVVPMKFNVYADLLDLFGQVDPTFESAPSPTYAGTCRTVPVGERKRLESWGYPLTVGQTLPSLPIWLTETHGVTLDLDASYEDACRALRIR